MAEITRVNENLRLPLPRPGEEVDWPYIRELIGVLERELGKSTNATVNLLLDQTGDTNIVYFGVPNAVGVYPNGTWRIDASDSTEYLIELLVTGVWTTKSTLTSGGLLTVTDASIITPSEIYNLSHDLFADFVSAEHIDWSVTGSEVVDDDRIAESSVTQHEAAIDHDALTNFV